MVDRMTPVQFTASQVRRSRRGWRVEKGGSLAPGPRPEILTVDDVYGISRRLPRNYVQRDDVDHDLYTALHSDHHIVVFGSSKQGKTSLRKQHVRDDSCIRVACAGSWSIQQLYGQVLKTAGYQVTQSTTTTVAGSRKIAVRAAIRASVGPAELSIDGVDETSVAGQVATTTVELELDPGDVNDIIAALRRIDADRLIVLEDFHYLSNDVQREFSIGLKTFHEESNAVFMIIGVWLDENRLVQYNGDLTGRLTTINADKWNREQLTQVIAKGEELLGIKFDAAFIEHLIDHCYENVWIVQEVCRQACIGGAVFGRQDQLRSVGSRGEAVRLISEVVNSQSARYVQFIRSFREGAAQPQHKQLYGLLLAAVLVSGTDVLELGLHRDELFEFVSTHYEGGQLELKDFEEALSGLTTYQLERVEIMPTILDYDRSQQRINIVDRGFLIWLEHQSLDTLLGEAALPSKLVLEYVTGDSSHVNKHKK